MNKEIVFFFKNGANKYLVYKENDEYIAAKYVGDNISINLNNEEKKLINYVFSKMCVSASLLDLGLLPFMGNTYHHYYDKENNWHTFTTENGGAVPTNIIYKLNKLFNYQDNIVYISTLSPNSNFIKRIVKYGKKTLIVLASATIFLVSGCSLQNTEVSIEEKTISSEEYQSSQTFNDDKILHIIDELDLSESLEEQTEVVNETVEESSIESSQPIVEETINNALEVPIAEKPQEQSETIVETAIEQPNESSQTILDEERVTKITDEDIAIFLNQTSMQTRFISGVSFKDYLANIFANCVIDDDYIIRDDFGNIIEYKTRKDKINELITANILYLLDENDKEFVINVILQKNNITLEELQKIDYAIDENLSNEEKATALIELLRNNPRLSEEEKNLFLSNLDVFYDNMDYFDYDSLTFNLSKLEIKYIKDSNGSIGGDYLSNRNSNTSIIRIYNCEDFAHADKGTLTHEFCHALESTDREYDASGLWEVTNSKFNDEYFGPDADSTYAYDCGYPNIRKYFIALAEIINPEVLKKFHSTQDISELKNELMRLIPNEEMFYTMLGNLNALKDSCIYYNEESKEFGTANELNSISSQLTDMFNQYYIAKYGVDMSTNIELITRFEGLEVLKDYLDLGGLEYKYFFPRFINYKRYFNINSPYYMKSSKIIYADTLSEYEMTFDIDHALYLEYVSYIDGVLTPNDSNVRIDGDTVFVKDYYIMSQRTVSLDEIDLNETFSR